MLNFWLRNFGFHSRRLHGRRRFGELRWRGKEEFVALYLGERPGFNRSGQIPRRLSLDREPLYRPARVRVHDVEIRAIVIDHVILHGDIGHVHGARDVGDVLHRRKDPVTQDWLADKPNIAEVVILRTDIEHDIDVHADGLSFINNPRPARRQRRPANVIATRSP